MKVAKTNAKKTLTPKRNDIDDTNIMFECNSAFYLISKDEFLKMTPGHSEEKAGVKVEVESKTNQYGKKDNNPATIVKLKVNDLESKFESKVTINLYHSSQGIHLQGGRRQGKITSCSLVANFLEEFFKETLKNKNSLICKVKETLLQMDLRKNYKKNPNPKVVKRVKRRKKFRSPAPSVIIQPLLNQN